MAVIGSPIVCTGRAAERRGWAKTVADESAPRSPSVDDDRDVDQVVEAQPSTSGQGMFVMAHGDDSGPSDPHRPQLVARWVSQEASCVRDAVAQVWEHLVAVRHLAVHLHRLAGQDRQREWEHQGAQARRRGQHKPLRTCGAQFGDGFVEQMQASSRVASQLLTRRGQHAAAGTAFEQRHAEALAFERGQPRTHRRGAELQFGGRRCEAA